MLSPWFLLSFSELGTAPLSLSLFIIYLLLYKGFGQFVFRQLIENLILTNLAIRIREIGQREIGEIGQRELISFKKKVTVSMQVQAGIQHS